MQVFVRLAQGHTVVIPGCGADTSVESFEAAVAARCGGLEDARLQLGGKQLAVGRTLGDYNLQEGSTVEQLLRLRGGGVRLPREAFLSLLRCSLLRALPPRPSLAPAERSLCLRSPGYAPRSPLFVRVASRLGLNPLLCRPRSRRSS